ncbi:hypothetical protein, partial [Sphaerisporangium melleum]
LPHRTVTVGAGGEFTVRFGDGAGPRSGEFRVHDANGALTGQGFNVLRGGRPTGFQYVVDHAAAGGPTWQRAAAGGGANGRPGVFHHGKVEISAGGTRVRLLAASPAKAEVFERRLLPGGGLLDSFRRTDTLDFGRVIGRRTTWAHWDESGALLGHGDRQYDTSGFGWKDVDHLYRTVHEYREGLQKFGRNTGHTLAVRDPATGRWTWHRFDGGGQELAHGPRTVHGDGGWTDRLDDAGHTLVQKQWGTWHLPEKGGHYLEYDWDTATRARRDTWQRQSPQGKDAGRLERLPGDNGMLTTERWSEQRPPLWVRKHLVGAAGPQGDARYLKLDDRYQIYRWSKAGGASGPGEGIRYVAQDGSMVDLARNGRFVRATVKLSDGSTLRVGDHAADPGYQPSAAGHLKWEIPNGGNGYRVPVDPAALQRGPHGPIWQDRYLDAASGEWRMVREGFADGSIREYGTPLPVDPASGATTGRAGVSWVQRDPHGNLTGVRELWQDPQGVARYVQGSGRPDSSAWTWSSPGHGSGERLFFRGSDDPRLPWDDSFRDFDTGNALVREQNMLDGGRHVKAWRGVDPATGQERWHAQKFDASGQPVPFGDGTQVRRWWNPQTRTWQDAWFADAKHWRDEFRPANGGPSVTLREIPPHLSAQDGPLRVREYRPGAAAPAPGTWKEFDHGSAVRERTRLSDGTFVDKDAWRGQWQHFDQQGRLIAQRTDSGMVFEGGPGGLRPTGKEYDYRGGITELRGWGRRLRENNRLPWDGSVTLQMPRMRAAVQDVPGLTPPATGSMALGEAAYASYWKVLAKKVGLEFGQEFLLEFIANLAVNGIAAAVNNKPFTGQDALKSFANAAISSTIKVGASTLVHEVRGSVFAGPKSVWANLDSGKHEIRRPNNHDKHWANEWGGNENPTRWRGGTYDFTFGVGTSVLAGWVNGSMNAAVWGITGPDGETHKLTGGDAVRDGGIVAASAAVTVGGTALAKNLAIMGGGSRYFHRQGFGEFWLQMGFKTFEKLVSTLWLTNAIRTAQPYYQHLGSPPPAQNPAPQGPAAS